MDPEFLDTEGEHQHDDSVSSTSYKFEGELNVNKLQSWIRVLIQTKAQDLFRYKGVLAVRGMEKKFVFQGVHMLFSGGFNSGIASWKAGEKAGVSLCFHRPEFRQESSGGRFHGLQSKGQYAF